MFQYKPIADPQLSPRAGYVEDENENGERVYRYVPTPQDEEIAALKQQNAEMQETLDALLGVIPDE